MRLHCAIPYFARTFVASRRALVEPLEARQLLHGLTAFVPAPDSGLAAADVASLNHANASNQDAIHLNQRRQHRQTAIAWNAIAPSLVPRFESAAETVGGKLYVFGGFVDQDVHATPRSDVYDPRTNTWQQIADMPEPLTHTGHVVIGNTIWFVGGFVGDEGQTISPSTTHAWIYNTKSNTWSSGPDLPAPRGAGALVKVGNTLHFFGGLQTRDQDQAEHWVLNLKHATGWTVAPPLPVAVNHLAGVTVGGKIYAIGGQHLWDEDSGNTDAVQIFDPKRNAWTAGPSLPAPRGHIADSTFVLGNRIIVVGGASNGMPALDDMIAYDMASRKWSTLGTLPAGRRAPVARAIGGRVLFATGDPGDVSATSEAWITAKSIS